MPFPTAIVTAAGRKIFRDARGKFISEKAYNLLNRRNPATGRFIKASEALKRGSLADMEQKLRSMWGAAPKNKDWMQIVSKYEERFKPYMK